MIALFLLSLVVCHVTADLTTTDGACAFQCLSGYCVSEEWECDDVDYCSDDGDSSKCGAPSPVKLCPPVATSTSVSSVTCHSAGKEVNCSLPMHRGTVAVSKCADRYYTLGRIAAKTATCLENGAWSNDHLTCIDDLVCQQSQFTCTDGECKPASYACDTGRDCKDGSDEDAALCAAHFCPPALTSAGSSKVTCKTRRGDPEDCMLPAKLKTRAEYTCAKGYRTRQGSTTTSATCQLDGTWSESDVCQHYEKPCEPIPSHHSVSSVFCYTGNEEINCSLPVPYGTIAVTKCIEGHHVGKQTSKISTCGGRGIWTMSEETCKPGATCPPVTTGGTVSMVRCHSDSAEVDCSLLMYPGTVAVSRCSGGHYGPEFSTSHVSTCSSDGSWTNQEAGCARLDCGRPTTVTNKIEEGDRVQQGQLPWNIVVYMRQEGSWSFLVTGTLITHRVVIIPATSVVNEWQETAVSNLRLAAGKHVRNFTRTERSAQFRDVTAIIVHEDIDYEYKTRDIAMLLANQSFSFSNVVNIACVDWLGVVHPPTPGDILISTATRRSRRNSNLLLVAQSHRLESTHPATSTDHFNARPTDNSTCFNARGAGLLLQHETSEGERFFLTGILSSMLTSTKSGGCYVGQINSYNNVTQYLPWIRQRLGQVRRDFA